MALIFGLRGGAATCLEAGAGFAAAGAVVSISRMSARPEPATQAAASIQDGPAPTPSSGRGWIAASLRSSQ